MEGGAEDFFLKPVQLSDLKKLQPHLLKSLSQCPCENISGTIHEDDENYMISKNSSKSNTINTVSKRKALAFADPLERRSKLKD